GAAPRAAPATAPAPAAPAATAPAAADPSGTAAAPASVAATRPPVPVGVPTTVHLTRLGVQAPVDPVGLKDGELQVPDDGNRLGWWTGSVLAGSAAGTTVIDGHIDTPQGRGVFYHLKDIQPDDEIVVGVAGGATVTYRVTERRTYAKAGGLPPEVFGDAHGAARLVLITCGGPYDAVRAEYDDNVVVTAVPV
ncbi:class F sortase, partial [Nakamurella sp.]|uniref:class F sortase n=1 Tax=Nakamurella sp. TaxID=1869182 RepID=UPI003B3A6226